MPEPHARIIATLYALGRRERRNLLLQSLLGALAFGFAAWALLMMAVRAGIATPSAGVFWILLLGAAFLGAAAWPLRRWRAAREVRRQARLVEDLRPELRGALLTVLDRAARPLGSSTLVARLAERVVPTLVGVSPAQAHPADAVRRIALLALLAVASLGLTSWLQGQTPVAALAALWAPASDKNLTQTAPSDGPRALVGDLTLRYVYPTYTGLEPVEVPNSNGEVHAPPGTRVEVRARTAERYDTAALRVYDAQPTPVEIVGGRAVSGAFAVAGAGIWRFEFSGLASPDYRIVPEPDLPPDVGVAGARAMTVSVDDKLQLQWNARDDYGLTTVEVEVVVGPDSRRVPLRKLLELPREVGGDLRITPSELGLVAGDEATLRVLAWDNDEVSGSKSGASVPIKVEVIGPVGRAKRVERYRRKMRDALVLVLADFVVEQSPPFDDGRDAEKWVASAGARYASFDALVEEAWGGAKSSTFDQTMLDALHRQRREFFSFARSLSSHDAVATRDAATLVELQAKHLAGVEHAALMLDEVVRRGAQEDLAVLAKLVAKEAGELREEFSGLSPGEALARLDQLQRLMSQLRAAVARLDDGQLREFMNDRTSKMDALMKDIRKAIAEGRMDDARALMERLAAQMDQMLQDLSEMQKRQETSDDSLKDAMAALKKELQTLAEDQKAVREETAAARERFGSDMDEAIAAWEEVERLSEGIAEKTGEAQARLGAFREDDYVNRLALEDSHAEAEGLHDSARARDLQNARSRGDRLHDALEYLQSRLGRSQARAPSAEITAAQRAARSWVTDAERIQELLTDMQKAQRQSSPELQEALEGLAQKQDEISERAGKADQHASQVAGELPMSAPGLREGTRQGVEQSGRAGEAMREGDAMSAEGGQRAAESGMKDALSALDEAERNLNQMRQASRGQGKDGEREPGDRSGDGSMTDGLAPLPAPEEFQTPEEYRKALLEGMEGDVPDEYKALNRWYYEDLVRQ